MMYNPIIFYVCCVLTFTLLTVVIQNFLRTLTCRMMTSGIFTIKLMILNLLLIIFKTFWIKIFYCMIFMISIQINTFTSDSFFVVKFSGGVF